MQIIMIAFRTRQGGRLPQALLSAGSTWHARPLAASVCTVVPAAAVATGYSRTFVRPMRRLTHQPQLETVGKRHPRSLTRQGFDASVFRKRGGNRDRGLLGVLYPERILRMIHTQNEGIYRALIAQLDKLAEGDILILAGSIPASLPQSVYERLLARLQGRGVRAVVDATRDLLVNVLPYHPFLIKPNNHELGEIVGKVLTTDAEIVAAARTLQEKGARNVLVSMAGDGALLLDEQGQVHRIGCPKGKVVNSVGAGDSMVAGFVAGYLQSRSYAQALRLGTACGSATAFSLGLATKEKIDELLAQL